MGAEGAVGAAAAAVADCEPAATRGIAREPSAGSPPPAAGRSAAGKTLNSREFVRTLVAKGGGAREFTSPRFKHSTRFNPMPVMPADVDPRLVTSHEDMGERASFHTSMYHTVRTNPYRYSAAFKSTCERFGDDRRSFLHAVSSPGFLEYEDTPRAAPSISHALTRPATSINGADSERTYRTTFRTKYEWPKNIELPINGGGIHAQLDRKTRRDSHGTILVFEKSMADAIAKTAKTYASTFKAGLKDHTLRKQDRVDFRSPEHESAHPTSIERRQAASLMNYSTMTAKSSPERFTIPKSATDDIRDWYDIGRSATPDLAVAVERSPIKYSAFHATTTHPHNVGKDLPASQRPMSVSPTDVRDPSDAGLGSTKRVKCPTWNRAARFLPDGHPLSMIPARACNNELTDSTTGTIAHDIAASPVRVKTMSSRTGRTTEVDLCYNPRPGSRLYVTRSQTEWYENAGKALPDGRMPIADRVASTPQTYNSSLQSQTLRSDFPPSLDPRQTFEHDRRRQHILESRIQAMRDSGKTQMSAKMAKILNIQTGPAFQPSTVTHDEQQAMLQEQSQDLHRWLQGPSTPARVRSVASDWSASGASGAPPSTTRSSGAPPSTTRSSGSKTSKATVGQEKIKTPNKVLGVTEEKVGKVAEER